MTQLPSHRPLANNRHFLLRKADQRQQGEVAPATILSRDFPMAFCNCATDYARLVVVIFNVRIRSTSGDAAGPAARGIGISKGTGVISFERPAQSCTVASATQSNCKLFSTYSLLRTAILKIGQRPC